MDDNLIMIRRHLTNNLLEALADTPPFWSTEPVKPAKAPSCNRKKWRRKPAMPDLLTIPAFCRSQARSEWFHRRPERSGHAR